MVEYRKDVPNKCAVLTAVDDLSEDHIKILSDAPRWKRYVLLKVIGQCR